MQTGALIAAAGMSSRMGQFKPMLNIGSISVAQRIVATLQQAGVDKIVMVTGHNAVTLERHLAGNGIIFLRNEHYETTQMFDSVKIGLSYLHDKCDRVLFTPVDVPLFTAKTVRTILESGEDLACPECEGVTGHPIIIAGRLLPEILAHDGTRGLRGAMDHCSQPLVHIPVEDPGTLIDADTPEDFAQLLKYHNDQLVRPMVTLALTREKPFFDEKIAMLLQLVEETHSVRAACMRMQISYSSGWNIIRTLESQLNYPLLLRSQGGAKGSQSCLTPEGQQLLRLYSDCRAELQSTAKQLYEKYFGRLF